MVRFWPLPTGEPMYDLPLRDFLERLDTLTNVRLRDDRPEGEAPYWLAEFPGWATPPEW